MELRLRYDPAHRILLIEFRETLTNTIYLAAYEAVKEFMDQHGPHHGIWDFSLVDNLSVSNQQLNQVALMAPVIPVRMRRFVVVQRSSRSAPAGWSDRRCW